MSLNFDIVIHGIGPKDRPGNGLRQLTLERKGTSVRLVEIDGEGITQPDKTYHLGHFNDTDRLRQTVLLWLDKARREDRGQNPCEDAVCVMGILEAGLWAKG